MKTFHIQTLGCKVNHYESEQIATLLISRGLTPAEAGSADLRVIHTCSVTTQAASQSRQSVRRMVRLPVLRFAAPTTSCNTDSPSDSLLSTLAAVEQPAHPAPASSSRPRVLVTGCWATSNSAEASALPGVDAVVSHHQDIASEIDRLLLDWQVSESLPINRDAGADSQLSALALESLGDGFKRKVETATPVGQRTDNIEPKRYETVNAKVKGEECRVQNEDGTVGSSPMVVRTAELKAISGSLSPVLRGEGRGVDNRSFAITRAQATSLAVPPLSTEYGGNGAERRTIGASSLPLLNLRQPGRQRAFLKIQDGCDAHCTYCIIPSLRPTLWSKPVDDVVQEANSLIAAGHVELVLTGIFLGAYGQPTALRRRQPQSTAKPIGALIDALCTRVPGLRRLRLSSLEPGDLTEELIAVLRSHKAVVPHFHLPLQSGSDLLLRRMNRQYTRDDFLRMVERVNLAFDRPALTTDVVVGFPGETNEEFERTVEVVRAAGFIHVHAFPYSPRPGTAAARWTRQFVRGPVVNERIERLRIIGEEQSFAFRQMFVGETVEVIIERDEENASGETPARHGRCERYFSVMLDAPGLEPGETARAIIYEVMRDRTMGRTSAGAIEEK